VLQRQRGRRRCHEIASLTVGVLTGGTLADFARMLVNPSWLFPFVVAANCLAMEKFAAQPIEKQYLSWWRIRWGV